ncbi:MAG: hypothetical protein LUF30_05600 [Lachnospiraceae bacterium]|nr:hypothetical protein [Lachnospiraceae bacterium]
MKAIENTAHVAIYLPESFEWLILKSGIVRLDNPEGILENILEDPENYIESSRYFSWERFFTSLLIQATKDSFLRYSKKKLNEVYLHEGNSNKIVAVIEKIEL